MSNEQKPQITLDGLIAELQALKAAGVAGDTPIIIGAYEGGYQYMEGALNGFAFPEAGYYQGYLGFVPNGERLFSFTEPFAAVLIS